MPIHFFTSFNQSFNLFPPINPGVAEWTSSTVSTDSVSASVRSLASSSSQVYRVFDHVTVSLSARDAFTYAPQLNITLVNDKPYPWHGADGLQQDHSSGWLIAGWLTG